MKRSRKRQTTQPANSRHPGRRVEEEGTKGWKFLTNHSHTIICLLRDSRMRVRDLAVEVGITERAVLRILSELERDDVLSIEREGRRNHYALNLDAPLRHPLESHCSLRQLVKFLK